MNIFLILHNIRSLHNVGSIFRTAEGLGVKKIYLTGYTPEPYDIFGKLRKDFQKTALGAEKIQIIALEQSKKSLNLNKFSLGSRTSKSGIALILGNEVRGISKSILKK